MRVRLRRRVEWGWVSEGEWCSNLLSPVTFSVVLIYRVQRQKSSERQGRENNLNFSLPIKWLWDSNRRNNSQELLFSGLYYVGVSIKDREIILLFEIQNLIKFYTSFQTRHHLCLRHRRSVSPGGNGRKVYWVHATGCDSLSVPGWWFLS